MLKIELIIRNLSNKINKINIQVKLISLLQAPDR